MKIPIIDMDATGENIKRIRKSKGILVRELQDVFGFNNPQAIYKWQSGKSVPSVDNIVVLAAVFGTTVDDIIVTM